MVDVCVVFTQFYCENRFRTPPWCASFSVPLLTLWDENGLFRVPAIACSKSILIRPVHSKSTSRKKYKFRELSSLEPVRPRDTFRELFGVQNGSPKCSEYAQARAKCFSQFYIFWAKSTRRGQGQLRSTSGTKSRLPENCRFHSKV